MPDKTPHDNRDKAVTEVEQALLINIKAISKTLKETPASLDAQINRLNRLQRLAEQFKTLSNMNVGATAVVDKKIAEKVVQVLDSTIKTYNEANDLNKRATKEATLVLDKVEKDISASTPRPGRR